MSEELPRSLTVDRLLRATINEILEKNAAKYALSRSIEEDLKELRVLVSRLERRLAVLEAGGTRRRRRSAGGPGPGRPALYTQCTVPGCSESHYALGLCSKHYQQKRRKAGGSPARKSAPRRAGARRRPRRS